MLFNAWLSEDEQVFKGMQDRTDGRTVLFRASGYRINVVTNSDTLHGTTINKQPTCNYKAPSSILASNIKSSSIHFLYIWGISSRIVCFQKFPPFNQAQKTCERRRGHRDIPLDPGSLNGGHDQRMDPSRTWRSKLLTSLVLMPWLGH